MRAAASKSGRVDGRWTHSVPFWNGFDQRAGSAHERCAYLCDVKALVHVGGPTDDLCQTLPSHMVSAPTAHGKCQVIIIFRPLEKSAAK